MNRTLATSTETTGSERAPLPTPIRKRLLDLMVSIPTSVLLFPLILVLALGSALAFRAWPLFVHERLGQGMQPFQFLKVRTLPTTTAAYADKYALADVAHNRWGDFLRGTHLDELPQLWLVAIGRMSLVGPRPEMQNLAETFDPAFVAERTTVRPGCTGLWQISRHASGLIGETPAMDLHYVRHWTLRLDLWILWRTALQLFGGAVINGITDVPKWTGAHSLVTK